MSEYVEVRVHPNSMAARKWNRTTWRRSSSSFFALAREAELHGEHARAAALRRAGARAGSTTHHC